MANHETPGRQKKASQVDRYFYRTDTFDFPLSSATSGIQHRGHSPPLPRHTARDTSVATTLTARHDTMAPKAPKELTPDPAKVRRRRCRRPPPISPDHVFLSPASRRSTSTPASRLRRAPVRAAPTADLSFQIAVAGSRRVHHRYRARTRRRSRIHPGLLQDQNCRRQGLARSQDAHASR